MRRWLNMPVCSVLAALLLLTAPACGGTEAAIERALPNDNRLPAGAWRNEVLELHLEARPAMWHPEPDAGAPIPAFAFAERGKRAQIPGPFVRVNQGTELHITVRNSIPPGRWIGLPPENRRKESTSTVSSAHLFVHGLRLGTMPQDRLVVPYGEERELRLRTERSGTFLYWAATNDISLWAHTGTDAQLAGAIIVDPAGVEPDAGERVFVITETDAFPDPARAESDGDFFELGINGLSWPHTERLRYRLGDTVRWRWINATHFQHPMHLHGFHFRTLARGNGTEETVYAPHAVQDVVTELMEPGSTLRMEWAATRAGNWLMHCHIVDHVTPFPERTPEAMKHEAHDVTRHPFEAMSGLVMGITIDDDAVAPPDGDVSQHLTLIAREQRAERTDSTIRGFALGGADAPPDELHVPGPPLVLTRGATTRITVVNAMHEPTTVHWHGLELESVYDGVAGWSRTGSRVAPLLAPGDFFDVYLTPPRAGTFIYHSHMDELRQVTVGLYGPLLVLEPGETFDAERDRVFVMADAVDGDHRGTTINGRRAPAALDFVTGTAYRMRFINISEGSTLDVSLTDGEDVLSWHALAKDGANLPESMQRRAEARFRTQAGETYDFIWRPEAPLTAMLVVDHNHGVTGTLPGRLVLTQQIRVHPSGETNRTLRRDEVDAPQ